MCLPRECSPPNTQRNVYGFSTQCLSAPFLSALQVQKRSFYQRISEVKHHRS